MKKFREWNSNLDKRANVFLLELMNGAQTDFKFVIMKINLIKYSVK